MYISAAEIGTGTSEVGMRRPHALIALGLVKTFAWSELTTRERILYPSLSHSNPLFILLTAPEAANVS
jgi:hypothetical protein